MKDIEDDCRFILVGDLEGHLRIFEQRTKYKMKRRGREEGERVEERERRFFFFTC